MNNIILNADSYKYSHYLQYPEGTQYVSSYIEARGWDINAQYTDPVFFGLQGFIKEYLLKPFTIEDILEAEEFITAHGLPFNKKGWLYILNEYKGYLPLTISAVPEGSKIPVGNVLVQVKNTDPKCFWLTSFIETALLRAIWYPTTVATISKACKNIIYNNLVETSDDPNGQILFKMHSFGARGVSSLESAGIGEAGHLINFMGTDTIEGILWARKYYNTKAMLGFSIPAGEHSTFTSWGKENEVKAYDNMLNQFAKPGSLLAVVSDSYDIYNAVDNIWGKILKDKVINSGAIVVIRPDSGNPKEVTEYIVKSLANSYGTIINNKGYKLLNNVKIIQGDGVNPQEIENILNNFKALGFAGDNIAFGMGAGLLQKCDRDSLKFAMKASAININDEWFDVFKDPITDNGKKSKKGILALTNNKTILEKDLGDKPNQLQEVFRNGKLLIETTFEEIREKSNL